MMKSKASVSGFDLSRDVVALDNGGELVWLAAAVASSLLALFTLLL